MHVLSQPLCSYIINRPETVKLSDEQRQYADSLIDKYTKPRTKVISPLSWGRTGKKASSLVYAANWCCGLCPSVMVWCWHVICKNPCFIMKQIVLQVKPCLMIVEFCLVFCLIKFGIKIFNWKLILLRSITMPTDISTKKIQD